MVSSNTIHFFYPLHIQYMGHIYAYDYAVTRMKVCLRYERQRWIGDKHHRYCQFQLSAMVFDSDFGRSHGHGIIKTTYNYSMIIIL